MHDVLARLRDALVEDSAVWPIFVRVTPLVCSGCGCLSDARAKASQNLPPRVGLWRTDRHRASTFQRGKRASRLPWRVRERGVGFRTEEQKTSLKEGSWGRKTKPHYQPSEPTSW